MHKLNKQCDTNKYASEYKCGSTDRDLNSFNSECGWASASCLSQISQGWVTKTALTSQQCLKSSKGKSTASSIPNSEYFFNLVQVTLEGVGVVPALFTITILFVSPRRINEFMRSLMTTMHGGGSRYTDAPFERTESFITRTRAGINTVAPRTSRPWKTRPLVRPLGYLDVPTEAHHSPRDGDEEMLVGQKRGGYSYFISECLPFCPRWVPFKLCVSFCRGKADLLGLW